MHQSYLDAIKSFEGFTPQAKWDYAQFSNGYGTKALYPGEAITPEEAEKRFAAEIAAARSIVEKHAAGWDEGTKAALTSLTFNTGTRWLSSGLGEAVRRQDIEGVKERFIQYTKADGEVLPGLLRRRLAELDWIGRTPDGATAIAGAAPAMDPANRSVAAAVSRMPTPGIQLASFDPAPPSSSPAAIDLSAASAPQADPEARSAQSLSMLMGLLFDLQMRSALADPLNPSETRADRLAREI